MATLVGTAVTGTSDAAAASIAAAAKNTTTGNLIVVFVKWEHATTPTLSTVTDTAGNTYTIDQQAIYTPGLEPHGAMAYCANATGNASNVVTANFSAATATFRRIIVNEFAGVAPASVVDGTHTQNIATGNTFAPGAITTTGAGVMVCGVAGFTGITFTAGGTPAGTLSGVASDAAVMYYLSSSGQVITPSISGDVSSDFVVQAMAFKNAGGGGATVNARGGIALSGISAIGGIAKSGISAIGGLSL